MSTLRLFDTYHNENQIDRNKKNVKATKTRHFFRRIWYTTRMRFIPTKPTAKSSVVRPKPPENPKRSKIASEARSAEMPTPRKVAARRGSSVALPPQAAPRSEHLVDADIVKYLKTLKPRASFMKVGFDGWPDRIICYKGYFIGIEVKSERLGHEATKRQQLRIREIRDAGGIAVVTSSVEDVKAIVTRIDALISLNKMANRKALPGQLPLTLEGKLENTKR